MRNPIKFGVFLLVVCGGSFLTSTSLAASTVSVDDQVAVLMKWYRSAIDDGKYKQAEQYAELASELAPNDPQIVVALKFARRQQSPSATVPKVEKELERVMLKLNRVEQQLKGMELQRRQKTRVELAKEPPGSPDANE
jgi:hypothetical protein